MLLSDVGNNSRTERLRKTKIGTHEPTSHVTRTPLSRSKGQKSRSPGLFTHHRVGASGGCSDEREKLLLCCRLLGRSRRFGAHGGRRVAGAYRGAPACFYAPAPNRRGIKPFKLSDALFLRMSVC